MCAGQLHNVKIKLVCNKHLAKIGLELLQLDRYLILPNSHFRWDVGHTLPVCSVKRKVIADVLEALIGAFFMSGGVDEVSDFLRRILLLPPETKNPPPRPVPPYRPPSTGMALKLESLLQYHFKDRDLLKEACTHPSWKENGCPSYQRLEFLGDAIIDVYVVRALASRYNGPLDRIFLSAWEKQNQKLRDISPGMVSDIREAAVNNTRLACVAAAHRCHHALRHCSSALMSDIGAFVRLFDETLRTNTPEGERNRLESGDRRGNNEALGKTYNVLTDLSYGLKMASAPKVMADIVESLCGAIYQDAECQLEPAFEVLERMMSPLPAPETVPLHPVRVLVEKAFGRGFILKFNIRRAADHRYNVDAYICLYLIASADGHMGRKSGKIQAARLALERWSPDFAYDEAPGEAFDTEKTTAAQAFAKAIAETRPDLLTAGPGRINLSYEDKASKNSARKILLEDSTRE